MPSLRRAVVATLILASLWLVVSKGDLAGLGSDTSVEAPTAAQDRAAVALAKVRIDGIETGSADGVDYDRSDFGSGWTTVRGCDMRNRVLARDLVDDRFKAGTRDCVVTSGTLVKDPYSGKRVEFVKGGPMSKSLDIDHMVSLSMAAQHGAASWTAERREAFANDPDNLLAVDAATNRAKGDDGPSQWLPVKSGRCLYAAAFTNVVAEYKLTVTEADKATLAKVLAGC